MSNFIKISDAYTKFINEQNAENAENSENAENAEIEREDVKLRLSNNLAIELTNTLNEFTATCSKVVKRKYATDDLLDKLETELDKIKNLINAAKSSI